jgi:hypothetical protein
MRSGLISGVRLFLLTVCVVLGSNSHAATGFERIIGGPDLDRGVFVSPTMDGGYVVVGVTNLPGRYDEGVYLVKTDAQCKVLWSRNHGGPDQDNGWSVHETSDGFVLAGFTKSRVPTVGSFLWDSQSTGRKAQMQRFWLEWTRKENLTGTGTFCSRISVEVSAIPCARR